VSQALEHVRTAARERKQERFTALLHHIDDDLLRESFRAIKRDAAPGVDGVTWKDYAADLERNLTDLRDRIHRGAYRALPSRRVYIPKADGRQRPLAVAALEDKIVQRAAATVLEAIYEEDFLGFSYGFRPGRGPHDALDALAVAIETPKVSFILDADIQSFSRGKFLLRRHTRVDGMRAKLKEVKDGLRRRMHQPIPTQGKWLGQVVGGFFGYHAVPGNEAALSAFRYHVMDLWRALRRRSQKDHSTWVRINRLAAASCPNR
jgi:hypothetical protein